MTKGCHLIWIIRSTPAEPSCGRRARRIVPGRGDDHVIAVRFMIRNLSAINFCVGDDCRQIILRLSLTGFT